jgi:hypothetical protein
MARPKKVQEAVEEQGAEAEAPASQPEVSKPKVDSSVSKSTTVVAGNGKRFASEIQERVFARQEAARKAKEKRKSDILEQAEKASKEFNFIVIPYKDRNGDIVPAIVLGVEDVQKKDNGGPLLDENNEPVMEAKLRVYVLSSIDEPRKVLHSLEGGK